MDHFEVEAGWRADWDEEMSDGGYDDDDSEHVDTMDVDETAPAPRPTARPHLTPLRRKATRVHDPQEDSASEDDRSQEPPAQLPSPAAVARSVSPGLPPEPASPDESGVRIIFLPSKSGAG